MIYASTNKPWTIIVIAALFVITAGFSIYLAIKQNFLSSEIKELQVRKESLTREINKRGSDSADQAEKVKDQLKKIEIAKLPWSKIIEKIESILPRIPDTNTPIIKILSYSGTDDGKITISASTREESPDPLSDIATAVRVLNEEPTFSHIFVPSISKSITQQGSSILSFSINNELRNTTNQ